MSRVGLKPIPIPAGVTVRLGDAQVQVAGPKGSLVRAIHPNIQVRQEAGRVIVSRMSDDRFDRSLHGLARNEIQNMVTGVTRGYEKTLEINGVGFRAVLEGTALVMNLGFSNPVRFPLPEGVSATIEKQTVAQQTVLILKGIDRQKVGQAAAEIRRLKPPEPYKGKGIKYREERIIRKEGKSGKTAGK